MEWIAVMLIFIATLLVMMGLFSLSRSSWDPEMKRVKSQLRVLKPRIAQKQDLDLTRKKLLSTMPWFHQLLMEASQRIGVIEKLDRLLMQANVEKPLGIYLLMAGFLGIGGFAIVGKFGGYAVAVPMAICLALIPFLHLYLKKNKRMKKFESQLPEALDLVARALRAGHAFSGGLYLVAQEFDDPIGPEFAMALDEINFGIGVPEALKNLMSRVDCPDLRFFVVSVILQRETGGNLAEILENIGRLMRDRFKLMDRVRTLSAEGRLSGAILMALPFVVAFALAFISPKHMEFLIHDPTGRILIFWIILNMIIGALVMRKIIRIKV